MKLPLQQILNVEQDEQMMMMQKPWIITIEDKLWTISNFKPWARLTYDELKCEFVKTQKNDQLERK